MCPFYCVCRALWPASSFVTGHPCPHTQYTGPPKGAGAHGEVTIDLTHPFISLKHSVTHKFSIFSIFC